MRFLAVAAFAVLFSVGAAQAQQNCGQMAAMAQHFADNYGERIIYTAIMGDGKRMIFLANDQTQSWTLVIADGPLGCVVASGNGVDMVPTGVSL